MCLQELLFFVSFQIVYYNVTKNFNQTNVKWNDDDNEWKANEKREKTEKQQQQQQKSLIEYIYIVRWEKKFFFVFIFNLILFTKTFLCCSFIQSFIEYTDTPMLTITNMPMGDIFIPNGLFFLLIINQIDNDADEMAKKKTEV